MATVQGEITLHKREDKMTGVGSDWSHYLYIKEQKESVKLYRFI